MNLKKLKNLKEFYDVVETEEKVVIYFSTTFCPDCVILNPYLRVLEKDFRDYNFYGCNRDRFIDLAKHLEIYGVPSFLVFEKGEETGRLVNKLRKSYIEVKTFIDSTITK
ncbi:Thioredoxin-like protein YtpP [Candidatus Izimaplasma bacterium HR1]|jgi:thiol-disulfide isomerase/thioredoxin|nr:Thioredoxin-like protein YtpP [Candidatus Izimaplasma bacterium HR1]